MTIMQNAAGDRALIRARLRQMKKGDIITDGDLSEVASNDPRKFKSAFYGAQKTLEREGIVFDRIKKVGYKRLDDREIVGAAPKRLSSIRRTARRGMRVAKAADTSTLKPADQITSIISITVFATISKQASDAGIKEISDRVSRPPVGADYLKVV